MSAPGLVIFDCDGVLVDSMGIDMRTLASAIAAAGGTMSEAEVWSAFHGRALADIEHDVAARLGGALPDGWTERFLAERAAVFERELQPIPGAAEAVADVRALGWETCIASGGRMEKMAQTLRVSGLDALFPPERIFSAYAVARPKPAPDLFLHAARACGFAPSACVVVEDSVPGVEAARAADMRVLAYTGGDPTLAACIAPLGAEVLDDMRELPQRIAA